MAESFIIFFVIVGVIALLVGSIIFMEVFGGFIVSLLFLIFGLILLIGGVALLVVFGGAPGALGIIMALIGALFSYGGVSMFIDEAQKFGK